MRGLRLGTGTQARGAPPAAAGPPPELLPDPGFDDPGAATLSGSGGALPTIVDSVLTFSTDNASQAGWLATEALTPGTYAIAVVRAVGSTANVTVGIGRAAGNATSGGAAVNLGTGSSAQLVVASVAGDWVTIRDGAANGVALLSATLTKIA